MPQIDVLVAGTPCQSFSFAGKRGGLNDSRGNLTLRFVEIVNATNPRFALWENVPGVLSDKTNAFGCLLGALIGASAPLEIEGRSRWPSAGMVSGPEGNCAWRCLDAQYFGLAQRRLRVFVVRCPRNGTDPTAILFERESVSRYPPARGKKREGTTHETAGSLTGSGQGVERGGDSRGQDPVVAMALNAGACNRIDVECKTFIAGTLKGNNGGGGFGSDPSATFITHSLRAEGFGASEDGAGRGAAGQVVFSVGLGSDPLFADDIAQPVTTRNGDPGTIAFDTAQITSRANRSNPQPGDPSHPLAATGHAPAVALNLRGREGGSQMESADTASLRASSGGSSRSYVQQMAVRRLTPIECERLQGFPDGYTKLDGKTADGPRYRALGNSMAVPVLRWILKQIMEDGK